jgi:hypothetical protein
VSNASETKRIKAKKRHHRECGELRLTEEIDCHQLKSSIDTVFTYEANREETTARQILRSSQRGYLTSTPEPPEAGFDGVHGVVSSLCEHHINRLSPTAMDWISFGASRKFLRALSGPISVTMNTGSNPVFRKRTCVLSTAADAAEPAKITNIQQTRNV